MDSLIDASHDEIHRLLFYSYDSVVEEDATRFWAVLGFAVALTGANPIYLANDGWFWPVRIDSRLRNNNYQPSEHDGALSDMVDVSGSRAQSVPTKVSAHQNQCPPKSVPTTVNTHRACDYLTEGLSPLEYST